MSKKRPRNETSAFPGPASKWQPDYWQQRLFKNSYTLNGQRFRTNKWCIKLQYLGQRKTFSLHSPDPTQAAGEACALYRAIVTDGWQAAVIPRSRGSAKSQTADSDRMDPDHWAQRLMHREYPSQIIPRSRRELSVRIDHDGTSCYFPVGSGNREQAARRALRIYRMVSGRGWEFALKRFTRELTLAFHWSDSPLAWTYTTFHTEKRALQVPPPFVSGQPEQRVRVTIAESDAGIRVAIANCVQRMPGFACVAAFANPGDALQHARTHSPHLALIGQNVAEKPGALYLEELRSIAPDVAGLIYSVHEDSEELFRTTPGGAGYYLLKRVDPTRFLDPIAEVLGRLSPSQLTDAAWQYFKNTVLLSPIGGSTQELTNLTQREHEVLALLSKGHQDKAIADKLHISIYTVHVHVRNIFDKLGVHNRIGAVVKYFQK